MNWLIFLGLSTITPIITLAWLGKSIVDFQLSLKKKHCAGWKAITKRTYLHPAKIRAALEGMHKYSQKTINDLLSHYQKVLVLLYLHVAAGLIYIAVWSWAAISNIDKLVTEAQIIFFLAVFCVILCMFYIAPWIEFQDRKKATGNPDCDLLQIMADAANNAPTKWLAHKGNYGKLFMAALCATVIILPAYLWAVQKLWATIILYKPQNKKIEYLLALLVLMFYQYPVQKIISEIFKKAANWFAAEKYLEEFVKKDLICELLQNSTYLTLLLVTISDEGTGITAAVIGGLFLVDTFFAKQKELLDKL